jgi:ribosomal protein S18 acetylase RimI-like enzyme
MNQVRPTIPGSTAIIEPATWRDLNALRYLEQVCFPLDAWPLWDLIGVLTFPGVVRLKSSRDGQMIGFIAADIRRLEQVAWISVLGVLPNYRRRGIGADLLQACELKIRVPRVRLSVRASNQPAINLYTKSGYHHHGMWRKYYTDGEDALILEKPL